MEFGTNILIAILNDLRSGHMWSVRLIDNHLHKSKMATILQQRTIAKEVIVAWSHIIHALYILWGWRVHLWCVFYISKVPWAAKCKIQDDRRFNCCETMGREIFVVWYYFIHVFTCLQAPGSISDASFTFWMHLGLQHAKSKMAANCQQGTFY